MNYIEKLEEMLKQHSVLEPVIRPVLDEHRQLQDKAKTTYNEITKLQKEDKSSSEGISQQTPLSVTNCGAPRSIVELVRFLIRMHAGFDSPAWACISWMKNMVNNVLKSKQTVFMFNTLEGSVTLLLVVANDEMLVFDVGYSNSFNTYRRRIVFRYNGTVTWTAPHVCENIAPSVLYSARTEADKALSALNLNASNLEDLFGIEGQHDVVTFEIH